LTCVRLLVDGFVASAYLQKVSESVYNMQDLLMMVLWHSSTFRMYVILFDIIHVQDFLLMAFMAFSWP